MTQDRLHEVYHELIEDEGDGVAMWYFEESGGSVHALADISPGQAISMIQKLAAVYDVDLMMVALEDRSN